MKTLKTLDAKIIKGELANGCYSHQKNNIKYFVVTYRDQLYYGTSTQQIFKTIENG